MKYTFELFDREVTIDCSNPLSPKQSEIRNFIYDLFPNDEIRRKLNHYINGKFLVFRYPDFVMDTPKDFLSRFKVMTTSPVVLPSLVNDWKYFTFGLIQQNKCADDSYIKPIDFTEHTDKRLPQQIREKDNFDSYTVNEVFEFASMVLFTDEWVSCNSFQSNRNYSLKPSVPITYPTNQIVVSNSCVYFDLYKMVLNYINTGKWSETGCKYRIGNIRDNYTPPYIGLKLQIRDDGIYDSIDEKEITDINNTKF